MGRARDTQKSKVYKAERVAFAGVHSATVDVIDRTYVGVEPGGWYTKRVPLDPDPMRRRGGMSGQRTPGGGMVWFRTKRRTEWVDDPFVLRSVAECQAFVDKMCRSLELPKGWVIVTPGKGARWATSRGGTINLPRWARTKPVIIHEFAHELTKGGVAAHGPEFTREFIDLVHRFLGPVWATALRESFRDHRVKVGPKAGSAVAAKRRR